VALPPAGLAVCCHAEYYRPWLGTTENKNSPADCSTGLRSGVRREAHFPALELYTSEKEITALVWCRQRLGRRIPLLPRRMPIPPSGFAQDERSRLEATWGPSTNCILTAFSVGAHGVDWTSDERRSLLGLSV
jgi:hypothetical protein